MRLRFAGAARVKTVDAAGLDIRIAVPDDAVALAATTRLGFESYLEWAPAGWQPPPRSRCRCRKETDMHMHIDLTTTYLLIVAAFVLLAAVAEWLTDHTK